MTKYIDFGNITSIELLDSMTDDSKNELVLALFDHILNSDNKCKYGNCKLCLCSKQLLRRLIDCQIVTIK